MTAGAAPFVLPLSADAPEALAQLRRACAQFVRAHAELRPGDLLRTAARRRDRPWRAVAVGDTAAELAAALAEDGAAGRLLAGAAAGEGAPRVAWLVGDARRPAAGAVRRLCAQVPPLRAALDDCAAYARGVWDVDVWAALTGERPAAAPDERVALAALQLAAVAAWRACAPPPSLVAGAGAGTLAALSAAGALRPTDALHLAGAAEEAGEDALRALAAELDVRPLAIPLRHPGVQHGVAPAGAVVEVGALLRAGSAAPLAPLGASAIDCVLDVGFGGAAAPADAGLADGVRWIAASPQAEREPLGGLLHVFGHAYCAGLAVDFGGVLAHTDGTIVPLPVPPLPRRRVWPPPDAATPPPVVVPTPPAPVASQPPAPPPVVPQPPPPPVASQPPTPPPVVPQPPPAPVASQPPAPPPVVPQPPPPPVAPQPYDLAPVGGGGNGAAPDAIRAAILERTGGELGVPADELQADVSFFDLGADSLAMVNVLRKVEDAFGVRVSMRELFEDGDSPAALARLIASRIAAPPDFPPAPIAAPGPPPGAPPAVPSPPIAATPDPPPVLPPPPIVRPPDPPPAPAAAPPLAHGPRVAPAPHGVPMTPQQRDHLDRLIVDFTTRTATSKRLAERFRDRLADVRAAIGFRPHTKELLYPIAARSGAGAHIEDVDGNRYVDIAMGFGILLFGHDPPFVREAVAAHLAAGTRLAARGEDTGVAAELLCELTGMDRVAFTTSGTEAVSAALRIARAATGRDKVVMFHGSYHGHVDSVLARDGGPPPGGSATVPVSTGVPGSAVADVLVLDFDERALEPIAARGEQIAALLVEPVQSRFPDRQQPELLRRLRALADRHGIVLIFDEMLTGLRPHPGGAQALYGVRADLATYGKALGGGYPIGAVAGRRELLDLVDGGAWRYGDDSRPERETTFLAGTYMQHPVAMAAARATLEHLRDAGPALQEHLNARMDGLAARVNAFCAEHEHPLRIVHFGSLFRFALQRDLDLLFPHLMTKGVFVWEHRNFYLSTAHTDEDVAHVEHAVTATLSELRAGGWSPAPTRSSAPAPAPPRERTAPRFSVYYFGNYPRDAQVEDRYELLFETARFADGAGFHALWLPERHFHAFGGIFPNPSVLAAALARETRTIRLHAGSVVLPLHDPIRVAEEWSVVDNLSRGRVGIGVASGWHANDFALRPDAFGRHKQAMYEGLATVRALWRGEAVAATSGTGEPIAVRLHPPPLQAEPPFFTAILGNPDSYEQAGRHGLGAITNLMAQDVDQLAANVARYRAARAAAGLDPAAGAVVVLLHTHLAETEERARREAFEPLCAYLRSSLSLFGQVTNSLGMNIDLERTPEEDVTYLLGRAYERYCDTRALIGTVDSCSAIVERLVAAGADEIACFVDFGIPLEQVRESLPHMARLRDRFDRAPAASPAPAPAAPAPEPTWEVERAPVTFAQERMWFTERLHTDQRAYNEPRAIRLAGPLDAAALEAALADVVREQPTLRSCIREHADAPTQWIRRRVDVALPVVDVAGQDEEAVVEAEVGRASQHRFDLAEGPLWNGRLLRFAPAHHVLVLTVHHVVFDTGAARALARRLAQTYAARLRGGAAAPPPAAPAYVDHVRAQRAKLGEASVEAALAYWQERLTPLPAPLALPADRTRPETYSGRGSSIFRPLEPAARRRLEAASAAARVTTSMFLTTAFALALRALSGQTEIVLGTEVSDRPLEHEETIGLFLNTLVLRLELDGAETFGAALARVRATMLDAQEHAHAPFEEVVRRVNPPREAGRNPLFQVSIEFDADPLYDLRLAGVETTELPLPSRKATYDLTLFVQTGEDSLGFEFEYATALFDRATIEDLATAFATVLDAALADPDRVPADALAAAADADGELADFEHGPPLAVRAGETIGARVREHARREPARVAIEGPDGSPISYGALAERVERLADALAGHGVGSGAAVMLDLPQQPCLAVAMLAALAAGGAYAPVDVRHPDERKELIAAGCRPAALVCAAGAATPWWPSGPRLELDASGALVGEPPVPAPPGRLPALADPDQPAYVLHTSGSTGRPKGVVMPVAGLENLAAWHAATHPPARTLQYASPGFDVCTQEVVCTLANGGTVVTIPPETRYDGAALARALAERRVEQLHIPATPLRHLLEALGDGGLPDLRALLVGGEQLLLTERLRSFMRRNPQTAVWNEYGPTETHAVTRHRVEPDGDVRAPIGTPVPNAIVRLLEPGTLRRVPRGAVGELCVAGAQVASGYGPGSGDAGAFAADPWGAVPGARMYRTGDLARWRRDGRLAFVGRLDDQLKVRGNRVEPGEVQATLCALPLVADAAVLPTVDRQGESALAAYVVPSEAALGLGDRALLAELRTALARRLPEYMIPAAWALLTHLPVNASSKLDREALPAPAFDDPHADGDPAATPVEQVVRELWCAELKLEGVGATTSFFEVGGHSLNAVCVVNRVNARFGVEYPILDFFRAPTVRATAEAVERLVASR